MINNRRMGLDCCTFNTTDVNKDDSLTVRVVILISFIYKGNVKKKKKNPYDKKQLSSEENNLDSFFYYYKQGEKTFQPSFKLIFFMVLFYCSSIKSSA